MHGPPCLYSLGGIQLQIRALKIECWELNLPFLFLIVWLYRAYSKDLLMNQLDSGLKTCKSPVMMISGSNTLHSYAAELIKLNQASKNLSVKPNVELPVICMEKSGPNLEFLRSIQLINNWM